MKYNMNNIDILKEETKKLFKKHCRKLQMGEVDFNLALKK